MSKKNTLIVFLSISLSGQSQSTFQRIFKSTIGGVMAQSIRPLADHGYAIAGNVENYSYQLPEMFFTKTDADGNQAWTRLYQTASSGHFGHFMDVKQTSDPGYILIGGVGDQLANISDIAVVRTDANGDTLWTRVYANGTVQSGSSISQTADGGFIFTGRNLVVRTDVFGAIQWSKELMMETTAVIEDANGDFIVTGSAYINASSPSEITAIKLNASGDSLWTLRESGSGSQYSFDVIAASDGGYILSGYTSSGGVSNSPDYLLAKIDVSGNLQWMKTYGTPGGEACARQNAVPNADGGCSAWGSSTYLGDAHPCMYRVDQAGNLQWANIYNSAPGVYGYGIAPTGSGGYAAAGFTLEDTTGFYFIKTDSTGLGNCTEQTFPMTTNNLGLVETRGIVMSPASLTVRSLSINTISLTFSDSILCSTVGVKETVSKEVQTVYPNPCKDSFVISYDTHRPASYTLSDLQGRILMEGLCTGNKTAVDISALAVGTYLIQVSGAEPFSSLVIKSE
ncbi:MAG: hypothetical protein K0S33_81 [Bacteroidetes bacterium]|jgi:hypothetical protein|nr:hypothetical protein [Bacteroidota bacterium]